MKPGNHFAIGIAIGERDKVIAKADVIIRQVVMGGQSPQHLPKEFMRAG